MASLKLLSDTCMSGHSLHASYNYDTLTSHSGIPMKWHALKAATASVSALGSASPMNITYSLLHALWSVL